MRETKSRKRGAEPTSLASAGSGFDRGTRGELLEALGGDGRHVVEDAPLVLREATVRVALVDDEDAAQPVLVAERRRQGRAEVELPRRLGRRELEDEILHENRLARFERVGDERPARLDLGFEERASVDSAADGWSLTAVFVHHDDEAALGARDRDRRVEELADESLLGLTRGDQASEVHDPVVAIGPTFGRGHGAIVARAPPARPALRGAISPLLRSSLGSHCARDGRAPGCGVLTRRRGEPIFLPTRGSTRTSSRLFRRRRRPLGP